MASQPLKQRIPVIEDHQFRPADFIGGEPILDFVNTVTGRNGRPRDWIAGYAGLLRWAGMIELFDAATLATLSRAAANSPSAASKACARAKALREALFDICSAIVHHAKADAHSLRTLRRTWAEATARQDLVLRDGRLVVAPAADSAKLNLVADVLATRAVFWLAEVDPERLRMCHGGNCAWLFLDVSKAGRRRWCDMATCGNVEKARRHAQKHRPGAKSTVG